MQKIAPCLNLIPNSNFMYGNCILVDDDVRVLIDSGAGPAFQEIEPESIDVIMNTHYHYDHMRGNELYPQAEIRMHAQDWLLLMRFESLGNMSYWKLLMSEWDWLEATLEMGVDPRDFTKCCSVHRDIEDGQVIDCGKTKIVVLHTPGHTPGHCSFYFPDHDFAFIGDICLSRVGPWYAEPLASIREYIWSIERIKALHPKYVATSHANGVIADPEPVLQEYRERILQREQRIINSLKKRPQSVEQLAAHGFIYPEHPHTFILFYERFMIRKHLDILLELNLVKEVGNGVYAAI